MFKRVASTLALVGLASTSAFAAENAGFESGTTGWSNSANSSLSALAAASVPIADVYTAAYPNPFYTGSIAPAADAAFGLFSIMADTSTGGVETATATASYTFASGTTTSDLVYLRFLTADGAYYTAGGPNDSVTLQLTGSYGSRTYKVEIESVDGGGVNATYVTGDITETYLAAQGANGVDTGWLGFGVLGGTTGISLTVNNVYDSSGGNAPVVAFDYAIGAPIAAVPEPETYAMLLAGLGALGFVGRRRNKA